MISWYAGVLKNYAGFSGRARSREYWSFYLVNLVFLLALLSLDYLFGSIDAETGLGILSGLYSLVVLLPSLAVTVRRLHDSGRSGWWLLVGLVPVIGGVVLLFFLTRDSQPGINRYGPNPKGVDVDAKV